MATDGEIAKRALDLGMRGKDFALFEIPGYTKWSERKIDEGESEALIANLDARSMFLLPEEVSEVSEEVFEELLSELKDDIGE